MFKTILLVLALLVVLVLGVGMLVMTKGMGKIKSLDINDVNLLEVPDGVFKGEFEGARWTNEVEVTVTDHKITAINVIKPPKFVEEEFTEPLAKQVIEKQTLKIDVVSGATVTTKAILKSIENALTDLSLSSNQGDR